VASPLREESSLCEGVLMKLSWMSNVTICKPVYPDLLYASEIVYLLRVQKENQIISAGYWSFLKQLPVNVTAEYNGFSELKTR